jgi:hypothetical protein
MNGPSGALALVVLTAVILVPLGLMGAIGHAGAVAGGIGIAGLLIGGVVAIVTAKSIRDGRM